MSALGSHLVEAEADVRPRQDVYCYACDDAKLDSQLADHLGNFGIEVAGQKKTEKTMTELVSLKPSPPCHESLLTVTIGL